MKHQITMDTSFAEYFVGQNQCTCGWSGQQFDIGEIAQRQALSVEARGHRMVHRVARTMGLFMAATAITWFALVLVGLGWLFTAFAGWSA